MILIDVFDLDNFKYLFKIGILNYDTGNDTLFKRELYIIPLARKFLMHLKQLKRVDCHFSF